MCGEGNAGRKAGEGNGGGNKHMQQKTYTWQTACIYCTHLKVHVIECSCSSKIVNDSMYEFRVCVCVCVCVCVRHTERSNSLNYNMVLFR